MALVMMCAVGVAQGEIHALDREVVRLAPAAGEHDLLRSAAEKMRRPARGSPSSDCFAAPAAQCVLEGFP